MIIEAFQYASLGYKVFPCLPGSKKPMTEHGFHDATTDPEQIRAWWEKAPDANVAIATEGLLVIDKDGADNPWMRDQPDRLQSLEAAPRARTPRGGEHIVFRQPPGARVSCSAGQVGENIDVRANGGYLLVAPSVVKSKHYEWQGDEMPLAFTDLPVAPDWLVQLATEKPHGRMKKVLAGVLKSQGTIVEGERNATLASLAGTLRWRQFGESELAAALSTINKSKCVPPLDEQEVLAIAASISRYEPGPSTDRGAEPTDHLPERTRKRIHVDTDEARVNDEVEAAIAIERDLYSRGQRLVRLVRQRVGAARGHAVIVDVAPATLREMTTRHVTFDRLTEEGIKIVHPPVWTVQALHTRGMWNGIRELTAVTDVPFMRPDGTICQTNGYDAATGVLLEMQFEYPPIPEFPTQQDAYAAAMEILDLVAEFPFASNAGRAGFLAALVTVLARHAFEGPSPLFLFDANVRGAGKTLLSSVIGLITTGHPVPVTTYTKNQEELRKSITSTVMAGHQLVLLDNLEGTLGCATLDRALTSTQWRDRVLGGNQIVQLPMLTTFLATGNNVVLKADSPRRVIPIRLESPEERPETRSGFKRKNLLRSVRENRPHLVKAALIVLRAYWCAGRPDLGLGNFGGFEGWSQNPRSAVVYAGLPDPLGTLAEAHEAADETMEALRAVMNAWKILDPHNRGYVVSDLVRDLYGKESPSDDERRLRAALEDLTGALPARPPSSREIGNTLRAHRKRVVDGQYFDASGKRAAGLLWRIMSRSIVKQGDSFGRSDQRGNPSGNGSIFNHSACDSDGESGVSDSDDTDDSKYGQTRLGPPHTAEPEFTHDAGASRPSGDSSLTPPPTPYSQRRPFAQREEWNDEGDPTSI